MHEHALRGLLARSGQRALETMFFATPDSISGETGRPAGALLAASLTFQGSPPGSFSMILSEPVGRAITANFVGAEAEGDVSADQMAEVCSELANIICGSTLTDLASNADFHLSTPVLVRVAAFDTGPDFGQRSPVACRFELDGGSIVLFLALGQSA
jgi:chemotaxis protein CheY-P-specific phosphatase CheC